MKTHRRATATSAVVLGLVFVTGVLVGRAWDAWSEDDVAVAAEPAAGTGEGEREGGEGRRNSPPMYERVAGMTDAQLATIDSIVVEHRNRLRVLQDSLRSRRKDARADYEAQWGELVSSARGAIKSVMTEAQRMEYDSLLTARDEARRERRAQRDGDDDEDEGRDD